MNDCGLPEKTILKIWGVFAQYAEVEKAILYGSRAMGNYKKGSDIDLTLEGDKLTDPIRRKIDIDLDDLLLPYGIDLSIFAHLNHVKFRDHIERVGVVFYDKSSNRKKVGWKIVKLGDVAKVSAGNSAPQDKKLFDGGRYNFIRTADVGKIKVGQIDSSKDLLNDEGIKKLKLFPKGTILFPKSGASTLLNHRVIMNIDGYVSSHLATIKADEELADDKYIFYMLQTIDAIDLIADSAYPSLQTKVIAEIKFLLPPINHQRQIATKLDTIFAEIETAIVATRQKRIEFAKLKAAALAAFILPNGDEWENVKLGDVAKVSAGNSAPQDKKLFDGGRYNFIRTADVGKIKVGQIDNSKDLLNDKGIKKLKLFPKGTILFPKSGASTLLNHRVIMNIDGYVSSHLATIKANERLADDKYIFYMLQTVDAIDLTVDSAYPSLQTKMIAEIKFPLPPLKIQEEIVAKFDKIFAESDTAGNATQVAEQNYTALKKAILAEMFDKTNEAI